MKTPHVIVIAIVVGILGFLVFYSQQRNVTTQAQRQETTVSAPASGGPSPAEASAEK